MVKRMKSGERIAFVSMVWLMMKKKISFGRVFFVVRTSILVIERPQKKLSQIVSHVLVFFRFVKTRNHFFSFMT